MKLKDIDCSNHEANKSWRRRLLRGCGERGPAGANLRAEVQKACREDVLFWLNALCYTFDPRRDEGDRIIPWVTYPFQNITIPKILDAIGKCDLGIEKARTMTATWMVLAAFTFLWEFFRDCALGLASAKEELVDAGEDSGTLFWKCRFLLRAQPKWLFDFDDPDQCLANKKMLKNYRTGSTLKGYATTGDMGRSGRLLSMMIDEYAAFEFDDGYQADAATHAVTNSRIFNSTYKGAAGCFYEKMRGHRRVEHIISLPWTLHPVYAKGLYFDDRGKPHSPWYDAEVKRLVVDQFVKSELDMDPLGAASQFFPGDLLERLIVTECRKPYHQGRIVGNCFHEEESGPLLLWFHPRNGAAPFGDRYAVGSDIGMGSGASNSVSSAASAQTGEKVAELASAQMTPDEFAHETVALCRWLNNAFLIWESNGPGGRFSTVVVKGLQYGNVYYRRNEQSLGRKVTDTPGWTATDQNKREVYSAYATALAEGTFVNRHKAALEECKLITLNPEGKIVNSHAVASADPTGARENHADRPTADALCCKALGEVGPAPPKPELPREPDIRTFDGRQQAREREARGRDEW